MEKIAKWMAGMPSQKTQVHKSHKHKSRRQTFDSGIGMAESVVSSKHEEARIKRERHHHRAERAVLEAKRAITRRPMTVEADLIENYLSTGKVMRRAIHELWAIVMPMAHGKTYLKKKYGFIDVDDLMPGIASQQAIDNLAVEIKLKSDWNSGMDTFISEAEKNLSVLKFNGPMVIMVHDWVTAERLGARVMGSFFLEESSFETALGGRTNFQKTLARLNRKLVIAKDNEAMECRDLTEVEELCVQVCWVNKIPIGAPHMFRDFEAPVGYTTHREDVLRGDDCDLDDLVYMYEQFEIPKERVDFEVNKRGLDTYRGFGVTPGRWCEAVAGAKTKVQTRFDGISAKSMEQMAITDDVECKGILARHKGELGPVLCAHWLTIGKFADDAECVFRLYQIDSDRFPSAIAHVSATLAKSKFFMDMEISKSDRALISDMKWLVPKRNQSISASGVVDIIPDKPMLGSACTKAELEQIVREMDILHDPPVTKEGADILMDVLVNQTGHYMRDYLTEMVSVALEGESMDIQVEGETVQAAVLRNVLILMAQEGQKITDKMLDSVGTLAGYDEKYFSDVWYQMLSKANKLAHAETEKLTRALIAIIWDENAASFDDWSGLYSRALEGIVTQGKACLAIREQNGAKHNVMIVHNGVGLTTTTMEGETEWLMAMAASNVDVRKTKILSSEEKRLVNAHRCLRQMTKSSCLAIADMFARRPHKHNRMVAMAAHAAEVLPNRPSTNELLQVFMLHNGYDARCVVHIGSWAKAAAFAVKAHGGLGGHMFGGMSYSLQHDLRRSSKGEYRLTQQVGAIKKVQRIRYDFSQRMSILKVAQVEAKNCPSRRLATNGLSCADIIEQMCGDESERDYLSSILKL